ncbi:resolvase, N-terminal domain protein [Aeromicrobium marinum DSM 15272]|uniref:Resolvase, N-terminal domain protein n=1 Tax=Aeromicrobium marinum DSM 15272 TaxID=585531 RepID=E2SEQ8_9ACTN|nr:resolvase, N-terminal domain protein [Aeromicrobium marinum DSM 15272]
MYLRISQDRAGDGTSIDRQRQDCLALASSRGWTVAGEFVDRDVSAYSAKPRPQFEAMVSAIEAGEFDALLAYHPDRLMRRPIDLERLVHACTVADTRRIATVVGDTNLGDGDGLAMLRMLALFSAHQSDTAARRIRRKNDERAAAGLPHVSGERAYGYELDRMTVVESEAAVIREAARRFLAGESLVSIAGWLQADGVRTATGMNEWRTPTLRNLLKSPRIAGLREHRGEVVGDAAWPAIITRAEHEQIAARLAESAATNRRSPRRYLLSGRVFCGLCGTKMYSSPDGGRRRYGCRKGPDFGGCAKIFINAEPLEAFIVRAVLTRLDAPETRAAIQQTLVPDSEHATLADELATLQAQQDELVEMWTTRKLTSREWTKARDGLEPRVESVRRRLARFSTGTGLADFTGRPGSLQDAWEAPDMTLQRQAAVIGAILSRVVIHPAKARGRQVDLSRIEPHWIV